MELKTLKFIRIFLTIVLFYFCVILSCAAQKKKSNSDTVRVEVGFVLVTRDTFYIPESDTLFFIEEGKQYSIRKSPYFKSDKFYDSLKSKASRNKLTKSLYSLLFTSSSSNISDKKPIVNAEDPFKPFVGKEYGEIIIKRVPILEGSVRDTSRVVRSWYAKAMNKFHISTKKKIIKENIFIKTGERVDPYQLADNERILRQFRTIRDAKIYLRPSTDDPNKVDVIVVTQDVISIGAALSASSINNFTIDLYDRNILGFARDLQLTYDFDEFTKPTTKHGFGIKYRVPNVYGSYIKADFLYENYFFREQLGVFLSRDFFTPSIKYGGGISATKISSDYTSVISPTIPIPFSKELTDIWLGRSFLLKQRTNLIFQALWQRTNYSVRPIVSENLNRYFTNTNLFLLNVSILNRTYSKTRLIRGFGRTEDLTKGYLLSLTYGIDNNEFYPRNYLEFEADYANYFDNIGYFYFSNAFGIFKRFDVPIYEDGIFKSQLRYFSPLIKHKKASYRQFMDLSFSKGFNSQYERYLLVDNNFENNTEIRPIGDSKISLSTETVFFTPWYFYGCKFSLYNKNVINWLDSDSTVNRGDFYSSFSLGMRVLNESLVFPTIELKFTYFNSPIGYPDANELSLFNNYNSSFQDLSKGKPSVIEY